MVHNIKIMYKKVIYSSQGTLDENYDKFCTREWPEGFRSGYVLKILIHIWTQSLCVCSWRNFWSLSSTGYGSNAKRLLHVNLSRSQQEVRQENSIDKPMKFQNETP